jgi:hypothetical protein
MRFLLRKGILWRDIMGMSKMLLMVIHAMLLGYKWGSNGCHQFDMTI